MVPVRTGFRFIRITQRVGPVDLQVPTQVRVVFGTQRTCKWQLAGILAIEADVDVGFIWKANAELGTHTISLETRKQLRLTILCDFDTIPSGRPSNILRLQRNGCAVRDWVN